MLFRSPGAELLEPSSGNTGIALALVAKLRGHKLTVVMPANSTQERRQILELYGATIIDSPADQGSNGAVRLAQQIAAENPKYHMLFQYENEGNPLAHYEGTGAEIVRDLPHVDAFVAGLGTGGTLMGNGRRLKEHNPNLKVIAVVPHPGDLVQGLRSMDEGFIPPIFDPNMLDGKIMVASKEAFADRKSTRLNSSHT